MGWVEGWLEVSKFGNPVGPLIPLKTPCDMKFDASIHGGDRFRVEDFLSSQRESGREVCLILNIAATDKFYQWDGEKVRTFFNL